MRRTIIATAAAVCAATVASLGVAPASADTVRLPDHQVSWALDGGGGATVASRGERINRVAPLTMAGTTREVFASVRATAAVASPVGGRAILETGYQIGCMASFDGLGLGLGLSLGLGATAGVGGASVGPSLSVTPNVTVNVGPGQIATVVLGRKELGYASAAIRIRNAHINVDGCIGPASARGYTKLSVSTAAADDSNAVYGRVVGL